MWGRGGEGTTIQASLTSSYQQGREPRPQYAIRWVCEFSPTSTIRRYSQKFTKFTTQKEQGGRKAINQRRGRVRCQLSSALVLGEGWRWKMTLLYYSSSMSSPNICWGRRASWQRRTSTFLVETFLPETPDDNRLV